MSRTYDDITPAERKVICRSLNNHATDLVAESKRLSGLGQDAMSTKLVAHAGAITRDLVPIFDDQASLDLDEARKAQKGKDKDKKKKRQLLLTSGEKPKEAEDGKAASSGE